MRAAVHLLLAVVAAVGCVLTWLAGRATVVVAPVLEGEPQTISVVYYAPLVALSLILATAAGVLAVLGVARLRRARAGGRLRRRTAEMEFRVAKPEV